jgi:hypothetical protein
MSDHLSKPQAALRAFETDVSLPLTVRTIRLQKRVDRSADGQNRGRELEFEAGPSYYQEECKPNTHLCEYLKS